MVNVFRLMARLFNSHDNIETQINEKTKRVIHKSIVLETKQAFESQI